MPKKKGLFDLHEMKRAGQKITWLTAYDYPTATFEEAAGVDMILVGDSLGMCVYGYPGTVPVTMDQCIVHSEAVRRGAPGTFVVGDMPLGSYQASDEDAVRNAIRFLKEANVDAIKLEGGVRTVSRVRAILDAVSAHEHEAIRMRIKAALAVKKARGERTGQAPYGYALAADGRTLTPLADEHAIILRRGRAASEGSACARSPHDWLDKATRRGLEAASIQSRWRAWLRAR